MILIPFPIFGQGFFASEYYSSEEYDFHFQNWEIKQDSNGFLLIGNGNGISIFEGREWLNLHIGETGRGTSFLRSEEGRFYASGQYDFGYLVSDSINQVSYRSISTDFYDANEKINEHFSTLEIEGEIFFFGWEGLEVFNNDSLSKFSLNQKIRQPTLSYFNERVLVSFEKGIFEFDNGEYKYIEESSVFDQDRNMFSIVFKNSKILFGFVENGLYEFDGTDFKELESDGIDYLIKNYIYDGIQINDSLFAIATLDGGIVIVDEFGDKKRIFNENSGATKHSVLSLYLDHEQTLWMGLEGGIHKLSINTPISTYSEFEGLDHAIDDIEVLDGTVWASSFSDIRKSILLENEKVFQFKSSPLFGNLFEWQNKMYLSEQNGVFELDRNDLKGRRIISKKYDFEVINFDNPEELVLASSSEVLLYSGKKEKYLALETGIRFKQGIKKDSIIYFMSTEDGVFQLQDTSLVKIPFNIDEDIRVLFNKIGVVNDEVYVAAEGAEENGGLYKLNKDSLVFEKSEFFGALDKELVTHQILEFEQCENGDVWFQNNKMIKRATVVNGEWEIQRSPYQMIGDYDAIYKIHCEGDDVWFGGVNGLYQLTNPDWDYKTDFKTNITGIYVNNDSLIYGGFGEPANDIVLPFDDNVLRFTYAATSYIDPERNMYSYKLEGLDSHWSEWSLETQKDYNFIPEGDYVFKVRSRNVYEVDGREDSIMFTVLPPWHRTILAYFLYLVLVTMVFYSIFKVRVNQLLKVERMRTRIASDLHDEVSATLTGISYFAGALRRDKSKAKKEHFISLIIESAGDAKEKITDIVWSINPDNDNWEMFLSKCRRYASDLLESQNINYELKIAEEISGKLSMEVRQHLWMIYKEMLTNAVRHSNSSRVDVIMDMDGRYLKLIVQDDGQGFDQGGDEAGNGILNIKRRAEIINATLEVDSDSGFGTRWRLVLPL